MCNCPRCQAKRKQIESKTFDHAIECKYITESESSLKNFWPHFVVIRKENEIKSIFGP